MNVPFMAESFLEALLWSNEHGLCHDLEKVLGKVILTVKGGGEWQFELTAKELHWPGRESVATAEALATAFLEECDSNLPKDWREFWEEEELGYLLALTMEGAGTGFWENPDRYGNELTRICDRLGGIYIYIGDDAETYFNWEKPKI